MDDLVSVAINGKRLRELRLARKLTNERLAEAAGITSGTLSHLEQGKIRRTRLAVAEALAEHLGVALAELRDMEQTTEQRAPTARRRPGVEEAAGYAAHQVVWVPVVSDVARAGVGAFEGWAVPETVDTTAPAGAACGR